MIMRDTIIATIEKISPNPWNIPKATPVFGTLIIRAYGNIQSHGAQTSVQSSKF
jgi:hypothetical protein